MPQEKLEKEDRELLKIILSTFGSEKLLKIILKKLQDDENLKLEKVIKIFQETKAEQSIPLSIFSHKLQPAEALCKYLKENENQSYKEISSLINRNEKSVWATYQRAKNKKSQKYIEKKERYNLPISIFNNRSYSILESAILHLNIVYKLTNKEIAKLLNKSQNSIAVLMKRAKEKS